MDKEDWFIILFPTLVTHGAIWYDRLKNGVTTVCIFGKWFDGAVIAAIISGAIIFISGFLKYWLADRKQYKRVLEKLGDFKSRDLANILGVEGDASITRQLGVGNGASITRQLGVGDGASISNQIGTEFAEGRNLTAQHNDILASGKLTADGVTKLSEEKRRAQMLYDAFTKKDHDIAEVKEGFSNFIKDWEEKVLQNRSLDEDNSSPPQEPPRQLFRRFLSWISITNCYSKLT